VTTDSIHYGSDHEVIETIISWLDEGKQAAMVTVLQTWGSSPRPPGSLLGLCRDNGHMVGSVSGGCIEEDLLSRYRAGELAEPPTLIIYGRNSKDADRFGLPCGGRLELLLEEPAGPETLLPLIESIENSKLVERRVCLKTGEASLHKTDDSVSFRYENETVFKKYGPRWHLILVGAGQLAHYVASIALMLDYQVTLCDPRSDRVAGFELEGVTVITSMPDDFIATQTAQPRTAVVTLAHEPKLDDLALIAALEEEFFFIGALGSKRTAATRRDRLRMTGFSDDQIDRLQAPVGMDIDSRTPAEIALSIMAGLTAAKNRVIAKV